jgi:hypothetical protein
MRDDFRCVNPFPTDTERAISKIENMAISGADIPADTKQDWRTLMLQAYHCREKIDGAMNHGIKLIARLPHNSDFSDVAATTTALLTYKAGRAAWHTNRNLAPANNLTPADNLAMLYHAGRRALRDHPDADVNQMAKPFLLLADMYHKSGRSYDHNYPATEQGEWSGRDMTECMKPKLAVQGAGSAYQALCLAGLEAIGTKDSAVSVIAATPTPHRQNKSPALPAGGSSFEAK